MAQQSTPQNSVPKPLAKPSPIVLAGMKYSKEIILITCIFIAFGIYALKVMDKNEFPSFTIREGVVGAVYPGASVEQIEQEVLKPLEDYVFSYKEVNKKKTHSQVSGSTAIIFVELDDDVDDADSFWNEFKIGMEAEKLKLPPGVLGVETLSDFGETSALLITMQSKDKTYRELGEYMDALKDRLRTIESVGLIGVDPRRRVISLAVRFTLEVFNRDHASDDAGIGRRQITSGCQQVVSVAAGNHQNYGVQTVRRIYDRNRRRFDSGQELQEVGTTVIGNKSDIVLLGRLFVVVDRKFNSAPLGAHTSPRSEHGGCFFEVIVGRRSKNHRQRRCGRTDGVDKRCRQNRKIVG